MKSSQKLQISIITPTYNRAYILPKLYESLKVQTDKRFEWLVIDDGSTDETESLIQGFVEEQNSVSVADRFEIIHIKKENGGKHRAVNFGVKIAKAPWICLQDSDDYFLENAIEKLISWADEIKEDKRFLGVSGRRGQTRTDTISSFPKGKKTVDASDLDRDKLGLRGDKTEMWRAEIIKAFPFPEFANEKFMFEATAYWDMANAGYIYRFFPDIITISNYITDGLTKNITTNLTKNFKGYTYWAQCNFRYRTFPLNYYGVGSWFEIGKAKGMSNAELNEIINHPIVPENYNEEQAGKICKNFPKISLFISRLLHIMLTLPKRLLNPRI
jgi:glycosyltransferase involved in cell wall biosynthesis